MRRSLHVAVSAAAAVMFLSAGCNLILDLHRPMHLEGTGGVGGTGGTGGTGGVPCVVAECPQPTTECQEAICGSDGSCGFENQPLGNACSDNGGKVCDANGACVQCNVATTDCPATGNECVMATCTAGVCGTMNIADNTTTTAGQIPGDCKKQVCDGAGATKIVDHDTDPMDDTNDCTTDTCAAGMNVHADVAPGAPCTQNNGSVCGSGGKVGTCVECLKSADCTGGDSCDTNNENFVCVPVDCMDTIHNGMETGVDCGGPLCGKCGNDQGCASGGDCVSGFCNAGNLCKPCAGNNDCAAVDYCNNGVCVPDDPTGTACGSAATCASGNCVDGFCCDTACGGLCQACSAAKKGQGNDGTCGPNAAGTDLDNECSTDAVATCDQNGSCNGAGACQLYSAITQCAAASCSGNSAVAASLCNGTGTCVTPNAVPCTPYVCAAGVCPATCANDAQCLGTHYCSGNACVAKKANGAACGATNECTSGNCIDGFCCNTACGGLCQACNVAGNLGACSSVPAGADPANECTLDLVATCDQTGFCNGSGACQLYAGGTQCVAPTCSGNSAVGASTCDGGGTCNTPSGVACAPYICSGAACLSMCASDSDCSAGNYCSGTTCVAKKALGSACLAINECSSNFCADGVCCNNACGALCMACTAAKTGGSNGTCGNVAAATDPDNECAGATICAGGACIKFANGAFCTLAGECTSGNCVDSVCCNTACGGLCQACSMAKTGMADGACNDVATGTDPDNECAGGTPNCAPGGVCGP